METLNIVIVGVGGQGTLLASRVLGNLATILKKDVKVSEVHGMSQRGGSVTTYVRMGEKIHSPLVEQQGADYILAFEQLEALRSLPYLKESGSMIVNTQKILPLPSLIGLVEYPDKILATLEQKADVTAIDALSLAQTAGNERAVNTVLMGALAARLPFEKSCWQQALSTSIPERFIGVNLAAFDMGYAL